MIVVREGRIEKSIDHVMTTILQKEGGPVSCDQVTWSVVYNGSQLGGRKPQ